MITLNVPRSLSIALLLLVYLTAMPRAHAEKKEVTLSIEPGFAFMYINGQTAWGGGGALDLAVGVTDAISIRVTGVFTAHSLDATDSTVGGTMLNYYTGLGINYAIDTMRLVPYIDLSIGVLGTLSPPDKTGNRHMDENAGFEIGVGFDYLLTRHITLGVVARYYAILTNPTNIPVYFFAGPRFAIRFGG